MRVDQILPEWMLKKHNMCNSRFYTTFYVLSFFCMCNTWLLFYSLLSVLTIVLASSHFHIHTKKEEKRPCLFWHFITHIMYLVTRVILLPRISIDTRTWMYLCIQWHPKTNNVHLLKVVSKHWIHNMYKFM